MTNQRIARELIAVANLVSAEEGVDQAFTQRVRNIKTQITRLGPKKKRRLKQFGVGLIRPTATVEDLIGALEQVMAG